MYLDRGGSNGYDLVEGGRENRALIDWNMGSEGRDKGRKANSMISRGWRQVYMKIRVITVWKA